MENLKDIIPDLSQYLPELPVKKYPSWFYSISKNNTHAFTLFSLIINRLLQKIFRDSLNPECQCVYPDSNRSTLSLHDELLELIESNPNIFKREDLEKYLPTIKEIGKTLSDELHQLLPYIGKTFYFEHSYELHGNVRHPDIVTDHAVFNIMTTSTFTKIAKSSYYQLLCDVAIIRGIGRSVKYCGIIFPLQRKIFIVNIEVWDSSALLQRLNQPRDIVIFDSPFTRDIGSHFHRKESLSGSLLDVIQTIGLTDNKFMPPIQMFLRGNRNGRTIVTPKDIIESAELIRKYQVRYFTHASYTINLADPTHWALGVLIDDLRMTSLVGGLGVVVHVGKSKDMPIDKALDKMFTNIVYVLNSGTPTEKCPLLLETPAAQGTELCSRFDEFSTFYNRFSEDQKKLFKVCIDTCHVFAADHDPLEYIKEWKKVHGLNSIGLIHFNDSMEPKGSRKDRHAHIGSGHIGLHKLMEIAQWSHQHGLPLVCE